MNDRISRDTMLMEIAEIVSMRSTCDKLHVGAVISRDGRILASGYNGTPTGMEHCSHVDIRVPCVETVHAEANAIAFSAKYGISTDGSVIHTTHSPCLKCAQLIINAGIYMVVWRRSYRDQSGLDLLERADIACIPWDQLEVTDA